MSTPIIKCVSALLLGCFCLADQASAQHRERFYPAGRYHQVDTEPDRNGLQAQAGHGMGVRTESQLGGQMDSKGDRTLGIHGNVQAGYFAGAEVTQSGRVGRVDIKNRLSGESFTGTELGGNAGLSQDGVGLGANAFAGSRVSGRLGTEVGTVGVGTTGEAWSGLGAEADARVGMKNGKLKLKGELGAALGVGGKIGVDASIDFNPIARDVSRHSRNVGKAASAVGRDLSKTSKTVSKDVKRTGKKVVNDIGRLFRKR
ncbi:hypothetical protein [Stieleria sp.]|uniref:hypothetical protein n=1 Tax=Stieleria sp. TaxID=2795976 RepID=UPI003569464F